MKEKLLFLVCTLLFFVNTQFNSLHLIPREAFDYSKIEISEALIIGKLLNSEQGSIMENGGFTGFYYYETPFNNRVGAEKAYKKYLSNETPKKVLYSKYVSQIGGQAIFYSVFDQTLNLDNKINLFCFNAFNSLMLSVILAFFILWIKRKFGLGVAICSFLILLANYWVFLYGKSIWWCSWVYFFPFVYSLYFFENSIRQKPNFKKYCISMSLFFLIKFWFTGYEFVTVFLISSSIPYIYYLFENKIYFYIKFIQYHFISFITSFVIAISFQLYQFNLLSGDFQKGIQHFIFAFNKRTSSAYHYGEHQKLLNTLKDFHLDITVRYLGNSFINSEGFIGIKFPFIIIITLGLLSSLYLLKKRIEVKLVAVTWFSITAPLSWFILFKQHAYIHPHIDFFVWYCPFLLLIIVLISLTFKNLHKTLK